MNLGSGEFGWGGFFCHPFAPPYVEKMNLLLRNHVLSIS